MSKREKFATQVDTEILTALRALAQEEGRQLQVLVEEAFENLLEERRQSKARPHVMEAYQASHGRFSSLYEKLAE